MGEGQRLFFFPSFKSSFHIKSGERERKEEREREREREREKIEGERKERERDEEEKVQFPLFSRFCLLSSSN